jgi:hypothetical protein
MIDKKEFERAKNKLEYKMSLAVETNDINIYEFAESVQEFINFVESKCVAES